MFNGRLGLPLVKWGRGKMGDVRAEIALNHSRIGIIFDIW
jgi:hypothetical protein